MPGRHLSDDGARSPLYVQVDAAADERSSGLAWGSPGPFLVSLTVHLVLLIVLGLIGLAVAGKDLNRVLLFSFGQSAENETAKEKIVSLPAKEAEPKARETPQITPKRPTRPKQKVTANPNAHVVRRLSGNKGLDRFGNPTGGGHGLGRGGEFRGQRLLVWCTPSEISVRIFINDNPLWTALKELGFVVTKRTGSFEPKWLQDADQFWLFAGKESGIKEEGYRAIESFVAAGNGLYVIADNNPWLAEATDLTQRFYKTRVEGNYRGRMIIAVRGQGITLRDYLQYQTTSSRGSEKGTNSEDDGSEDDGSTDSSVDDGLMHVINQTTHYVDQHPLLTGIYFLFEGVTISHIQPCFALQTVLRASDGQILAAVSKDTSQRVVFDCGFTRYYYSTSRSLVTKTAGTLRYAQNIAAYLAGKDAQDDDLTEWANRKRLLSGYAKVEDALVLAALRHSDPMHRWAALCVADRRRLDMSKLRSDIQRDSDPYVSRQSEFLFGPARAEWQAKAAKEALEWQAKAAERQAKALLYDAMTKLAKKMIFVAMRKLTEVAEKFPNTPAGREALRLMQRWKPEVEEKVAASMLRLAELLYKNNKKAARRRLEEILEKHPATKAAKEAKRLLDAE